MTALMVAVWHRRPAVVAFLLNVPEVNVELTNILGLTAAGVVGMEVNTVSPVMSSGRDGPTPLHVAALDGRAEIARLLLKARADLMIEDQYMHAVAAHKAASFGHADVLRALVVHPSFAAVADAQGPFKDYTPSTTPSGTATSRLPGFWWRRACAPTSRATTAVRHSTSPDSGYDDLVALLS